MKMPVPTHIAELSQDELLHAFLQIYEAADLKDALQQWAVQMEDWGYNIEFEASA